MTLPEFFLLYDFKTDSGSGGRMSDADRDELMDWALYG